MMNMYILPRNFTGTRNRLSGDRPALTVDDEKALTMTFVRKARKKNGLSYYEHIRKSLHTLLPAFTA